MTAPLLAYYKQLQQAGGSTVVREFQGTESDVIYKSVKPFLTTDLGLQTIN